MFKIRPKGFILRKLPMLAAILLVPHITYANFNKLVKDVFPAGTMSNATHSSIVKEQSAGHIMGGSLIVKSPATQPLQLVQATAPSCKLGGLPCGAQIELMGGALSMISGQELMRQLKSMPAAAATYAGMMLIKTQCSVCEDLIEFLDSKADWLNQMSIDQCHAIQSLMDPMLPKQNAKDQGLRQSKAVLTGGGKDMSDFQRNSKKDTGDPTTGVDELASQFGDNYNIVWKALEKKAHGSANDATELKELLMSISGTIIGTKGKVAKKIEIRHVRSLVKKELIEDFIGAKGESTNKMKLLKCDEPTYCLHPTAIEQIMNKDFFLYKRVEAVVKSIVERVLNNEGTLSAEEETIVALSSEQLILKIEMDLATYANKANVINNQKEYIEALSYDVVTGYLQSLLLEVQEALSEIKRVQIGGGDKIAEFEEETRRTMNMLSEARIEARGKFEVIAASKERLRRDVDYFDRAFENFMGSQDQ